MASDLTNSVREVELENVKDIIERPPISKQSKNVRPMFTPIHILRSHFYLPAVILVVFSIPATSMYGMSLLSSAMIQSVNPCNSYKQEMQTVVNSNNVFFLQNLVVFLLFPVAGWLSDTKLSHYRMVYGSIWLFWVGVILLGLGYVMLCIEPCQGTAYIMGKYVFTSLSLVTISVGAAGFFPNILVLMMDMMREKPNSLIQSYIHWFVWALYVAFFFSDWIAVVIQSSPTAMEPWFFIPILSTLVFLSLMLMVNFFASDLFSLTWVKQDPYSTVFGVVQYAMKHKIPANRSAFTYWEAEVPGRVDLAKHKYGGPYSEQSVENVKTLMRMLVIYISLFPFFVGYSGPINQLIPFVSHLQMSAANKASEWFIYLADSIVVLVTVPFLEVIVRPLFPKIEYFVLKPLRWIFLGAVAITLSNIVLLILDLAGHLSSTNNVCFLHSYDAKVGINFRWAVLASLLWGACDLLVTASIFTFICSQAPSKMKGMLLGLFMLMQGLFQVVGDAIAYGFGISDTNFIVSCGFWYWLTLSLVSLAGCALLFVAIRFYQQRKCNDDVVPQQIIEDIYERRFGKYVPEIGINSSSFFSPS